MRGRAGSLHELLHHLLAGLEAQQGRELLDVRAALCRGERARGHERAASLPNFATKLRRFILNGLPSRSSSDSGHRLEHLTVLVDELALLRYRCAR
jgi:hypothetical protein